MNMNRQVSHNIKKSFLVTLVYVGVGTLCVLPNPYFRDSEFLSDLMTFLMLATLPVNFVSLGIMYADQNAVTSILIVQLVFFFVFWLISFLILKRRTIK